MYFGTKILDLDLLKSHSRNEVLVLVLLLGDWEQNGTEAYPSGTFYFDTLRMPSLHLYLFGENFEISYQKSGFLHLCGVCSVLEGGGA